MCAWRWNVEYLRVLSLIPSWREPWWGFSLLKKVILSDYYCPTIHKDVYDLVKSCDMFQRRGEISRKIKFPKNLILEVRLFDIWSINFMGVCEILWSKLHSWGSWLCLHMSKTCDISKHWWEECCWILKEEYFL